MSYILAIFIGIGIRLSRYGESVGFDPPDPPDYIPTYHYLGF